MRGVPVRVAVCICALLVSLVAGALEASAQQQPTNHFVVRLVLETPEAPTDTTFPATVKCVTLEGTTVVDEAISFDAAGQPSYTFAVPTHLSADPNSYVSCRANLIPGMPQNYFQSRPDLFDFEGIERSCDVTSPGASDPPDGDYEAFCGLVDDAIFLSPVVDGVVTQTITVRATARPQEDAALHEAASPAEPVTAAPALTG